MPRDGNGNYTLPAGNPVVSNTLIEATWANTTMPDLGTETTDSLSRSGKGPMLAPLKIVDADLPTPGLSFQNEPTSGILRQGAGDIRHRVLGTDVISLTQTTATTYVNQNIQGVLSVGQTAVVKLEDNTTSGQVGTSTNHPLEILQNSGVAITINTNRWVGINKTPQYVFDVNGGSQSWIAHFEATSSIALARFKDTNTTVEGIGIGANGNDLVLYSANSEQMRVATNGNVGVNDNSPNNQLSVRGDGAILASISNCQATVYDTGGVANAGLGVISANTRSSNVYLGDVDLPTIGQVSYNNADNSMAFTTNNSIRMTISSGGEIIAPNVYSSTVGATNRDLFIDNTGKIGYVSSTERHKRNVRDVGSTEFLLRLRPVRYERIGDERVEEIGLLAEQVAETAPQFVYFDQEGRPEGVDYKGLIVPILARLQQLEARLN